MRRKIISVILINIILMFYLSKCIAVTDKELQNEKSNVEDSISETQKELEDVKEEKTETMKEVDTLIGQINNYENEIDELESQILELEDNIKNAEKQIEESEIKYKKQEEALNERLVAIYENGDISYLDVLLSSNSLIDFISRYYMVSELTKYDIEMLKSVAEEKQKIENEKIELEKNKETLTGTQKTKEAKSKALQIAKNEKQEKAKELSQNEANLVKEIDELKKHENDISAKILQMQKEYEEQLRKEREEQEKAAKKAKENNKNNSSNNSKNNTNNDGKNNNTSNSNTTNNSGASSSYGFGWPVANPVITTRYGVSGSYWSSGHHTGIDFKATKGTPVYSIGNGQVFDTGYNSAYGNFVEIYHGNNIYSFYAHASSVKVSVGQKVSKGEQIMLSGNSGNVTGPHLHFEIRTPGYKYSNCVNPSTYLP